MHLEVLLKMYDDGDLIVHVEPIPLTHEYQDVLSQRKSKNLSHQDRALKIFVSNLNDNSYFI